MYASVEVLTEQENNQVKWKHTNPLTGSQSESDTSGGFVVTVESDPMGINVGVEDPSVDPEPVGFIPESETPMIGGLGWGGGCSSNDPNCRKCFVDGFEMNCEQVAFMQSVGSATDESWAIVSVTYRSGLTQTRTGWTTLAAGLDLRFRGQMAEAARIGFNAGTIWDGFNTGVHWAIGNGFAAQANQIDGRAGSVLGGFTSSFLPQNLTYPPPTITDLRADVELLLRNPDCAHFVENVTNKVYEMFPNQPLFSDYALHIFDTINNQGGFKFEPAMIGNKRYGGLATGYIGTLPGPNNVTPDQNATVTIPPLPIPPNTPVTQWSINNARIYYALRALNEIMHHAGAYRYSDRRLALAAYELTGIPGLPENEDIDANSDYFHNKVLNPICDPRRKK